MFVFVYLFYYKLNSWIFSVIFRKEHVNTWLIQCYGHIAPWQKFVSLNRHNKLLQRKGSPFVTDIFRWCPCIPETATLPPHYNMGWYNIYCGWCLHARWINFFKLLLYDEVMPSTDTLSNVILGRCLTSGLGAAAKFAWSMLVNNFCAGMLIWYVLSPLYLAGLTAYKEFLQKQSAANISNVLFETILKKFIHEENCVFFC